MSQPIAIEYQTAAGAIATVSASTGLPVQTVTSLPGNRLAGGAICSYTSTAVSATIKTGAGIFYGLLVIAPGTAPTVTVYDNTADSGTKILEPLTGSVTQGAFLGYSGVGIQVTNGIRVTLGGTANATVIALWA